jgi:cell shape-determining protein MreC
LTGVEKENARLQADLRQMEERLKDVTALKEENSRLRSEVDQMKASLKELHEIEQTMKKPVELPSRPEGQVR